MRRRLSTEDHVQGVLEGDRAILARTLTLVESHAPAHKDRADEVLTALLPHTRDSRRVGISGVPGVGKSTFIEALGVRLLEAGHRLAVLAVDPSSSRSGGSILGDKTRMEALSRDPRAFIRPSPTSGDLGGVHRATRRAMLVCEAAGYDVVFIETVGVGQSEVSVAELVDTFLVLMLAGAGDELQGIKRGILEVADVLAVHKADGDNLPRARRARSELATALHLLRSGEEWEPPVLTCSSVTGEGLDDVWKAAEEHRAHQLASGEHAARRRSQAVAAMWADLQVELIARLRRSEAVDALEQTLQDAVAEGTMAPGHAARRLLRAFLDGG